MIARSIFTGVFFLVFTGATVHAAPPQPIGSAVVVVNLVTAEYNRDTRSLQQGDRVHQDEVIEVGLDATSEFKLDDETKLALGSGSHLKLDKFVYDPDKTKGSIIVELVKGTFRFMTGVAEKPTYVIKTPAAAITVRGTIFDVFVQETGMSWLLLHEGAVQVCNARGVCKVLDEPGKIIQIGGDGDVGAPVRWASLPGKENVPFDNAFPFVGKSPSIDPKPIFTREAILTYEKEDDAPPKGTETTRPPKNKKPPPKKTRETEYPTKKKKRVSNDDDAVKKGVGAAIGIGIGIGIGMGKHKHDKGPNGPYGGGMGGKSGKGGMGGMTPR